MEAPQWDIHAPMQGGERTFAGAPVELHTPRGVVRADAAVIATGHPVLNRGLYFAKVRASRSYLTTYRVDAPLPEGGDGLGVLLDWGRANLDSGITVDDLATRGAMSPRTLTRRFQAALGMPPGEWLLRERLRLAQRLLERTDDPVELIARRAGYESAVTMRAQFAARLDTSPRAYRQTFRGRTRAA